MRYRFALFVIGIFVVLLINGVAAQVCEYGVPSDEFTRYEFEDNFLDSVGSNDGTSSEVVFASGKVGRAAEFDGVDDVITIPDSPSLSGMDEFTMSAWINVDSLAPLGQVILVKDFTYSFLINGAGEVMVSRGDGSSWTGLIIRSSNSIVFGSWSHVLFTSDSSNSKVYVDGVYGGIGPSLGTVPDNDKPLEIGFMTNPLNGKIDEIKLFSRYLDEEDVKRLYDSYDTSLVECSDGIDNDCDGGEFR